MDSTSTAVTIFGQEYTVRAGADPDYVVKVAEFVDKRMREVASSSKQVSSTKIAILAAMNITEELFQTQPQSDGTMTALEKRIESMVEVLEASVGEPTTTAAKKKKRSATAKRRS